MRKRLGIRVSFLLVSPEKVKTVIPPLNSFANVDRCRDVEILELE